MLYQQTRLNLNPGSDASAMRLLSCLVLICRLHLTHSHFCNHTSSCPEGVDETVTNWDLQLGRVEGGATYLGFKEVLGTFDALQGNIDLRQLGQGQQPTFLLQFPCGGLVEYEQELWGKVNIRD